MPAVRELIIAVHEPRNPWNTGVCSPSTTGNTVEIRSLRHFVAVADTLNFRIAGERLHLTQPALTRSIASLERELGVRLFDRDTRGVALTTDGAQLLERARNILASSDEFTYTARTLRAASDGELRVGLYGNGLADLTHPVLREFGRRRPDVLLQVTDVDLALGLSPLFGSEIDVAFVRSPFAVPGLTCVPIFSEPLVLAVWEGHPLAGASSADVRETLEDTWVAFPPSIPHEWAAFWLFSALREGSTPHIGAFARSDGDYISAVAYGHMTGVLPSSTLRMRPHPGVVAVPIVPEVYAQSVVAYPSSGFSPNAVTLAEVASEVAREWLHEIPAAIPAVAKS